MLCPKRTLAFRTSRELYGGRLRAHPRVAGHTLAGLVGGKLAKAGEALAESAASEGEGDGEGEGKGGEGDPLRRALVLVDTAGCGMEEAEEAGCSGSGSSSGGGSKLNEGEARAAIAYVARLIRAGVPASAIGVITPYSAQLGLLRSLRSVAPGDGGGTASSSSSSGGHGGLLPCARGLEDELALVEMSTVDGFQGREKEAIVISAVRSNPRGEVGFLADQRRMNVAVSRARRQCAIVGDSETLGREPFLARMIAHVLARGDVISAQELEE